MNQANESLNVQKRNHIKESSVKKELWNNHMWKQMNQVK